MDDDPWIGLAPRDDRETERAEVDPLLDDLERPVRADRRRPRDPAERQRVEPRAQVPHKRCRSSSATPSFTFAPSA